MLRFKGRHFFPDFLRSLIDVSRVPVARPSRPWEKADGMHFSLTTVTLKAGTALLRLLAAAKLPYENCEHHSACRRCLRGPPVQRESGGGVCAARAARGAVDETRGPRDEFVRDCLSASRGGRMVAAVVHAGRGGGPLRPCDT